MFKKIARFVLTLFVAFSLLAVAMPAQAAPLAATRTARGTVVAINKRAHVMTIRNAAGVRVALKYTAATKLTLRGKPVSIARLHVGDRVVMNYTPRIAVGAIKGTATSGDDTPGLFELEGLVSAVDPVAGTLDIASEHGGSIVQLKVDAATVIMFEDSPGSLANLQVGQKIEAKYDPLTMLASYVEAEVEDD